MIFNTSPKDRSSRSLLGQHMHMNGLRSGNSSSRLQQMIRPPNDPGLNSSLTVRQQAHEDGAAGNAMMIEGQAAYAQNYPSQVQGAKPVGLLTMNEK
jgi:hypothetical protein